MATTCITPGCTTQLAKLNESERCYACAALVSATQRYVENREVKVAGVDRWSAGQTGKRHMRLPYVRRLATQNIVPWDATLEEVEIAHPEGFSELRDDLRQINFFTSFMKGGVEMDARITTFSYDEAVCVETHFPESNFLAKWSVAMNGGEYRRFKSVADEEPKTREILEIIEEDNDGDID